MRRSLLRPVRPIALVIALLCVPATGWADDPADDSVLERDAVPELLAARKSKNKRPANLMRVHMLNVGQGDTTIIESPADANGNRRILMIDSGESSMQGNEAKHQVEPYLRKELDDGPPGRPVVNVDYFLISHYHKDHTGLSSGKEGTGLFYLWEALGINIGLILDPGLDFDASGTGDKMYRKWVDEKQPNRATLVFDQLGDQRQMDMGDDVWVEVLGFGARVEGRGRVVKDKYISTTSQNDFSSTIIVHYKKFDFYVAGDLSGYLHEGWGAWYHNIEAAHFPSLRQTEVYHVNHHGSQWSSSYSFLQRLKPKVSVISCGKGHHHPNRYTVQRLLGYEDYWTGRPMGSDIYQTKNDDGWVLEGEHPHTLKTQTVADGDIVIETDGETDFRIYLPGREPIVYALDDIPAYTDVPWRIKKIREEAAADAGLAGNEELGMPPIDDRDSVDEDGGIRGNDPEGGDD
jgi:beta-lactamase superfamily II metal-dependent hydrolase